MSLAGSVKGGLCCACCAINDELVRLLAGYKPAIELGFTSKEL